MPAGSRIGNFINGELWGKPTDAPWGFNCHGAGAASLAAVRSAAGRADPVPADLVVHVEAAAAARAHQAVPRYYGSVRFFVEFVRVPDEQLSYLAGGWLTMGQILSAPMILIGIILLVHAYRRGGAFGQPGCRAVIVR